jgi:hypothetical protein
LEGLFLRHACAAPTGLHDSCIWANEFRRYAADTGTLSAGMLSAGTLSAGTLSAGMLSAGMLSAANLSATNL